MFAEIAVDTYQDPAKKLFTYQIPSKFEQLVKEGAKVSVPFGKRVVDGYVWRIIKTRPPFPTKSVQEIKSQAFSSSQVKLAHWMTEYYLSSPLECLKCQIGKKGEREATAPLEEVKTLTLIPYASQIKIRATSGKQKSEATLFGSRSAVFAQLPNLKKIIIEEPENWNYKDERAPYYHAAEVAKKRGELENLEVELKPFIPSAEDFAQGYASLPTVNLKVVDLSLEKSAGNYTFLSLELENSLLKHRSVLVYAASRVLQESVRDEILKTGADKSFFEIFGPEVFSIPGKTSEKIFWVDADTLLNLPDFRAHEKLLQTAARLSRLGSELYIQTAFPSHPLIDDLRKGEILTLYQRELKNRKSMGYPPFAALVKLSYTSQSPSKTFTEAEKLYEKLTQAVMQETLEVSSPYEPYVKVFDKHSLNIAVKVKSPSREQKKKTFAKLAKVIPIGWRVEVDPESLL